MIKLNEQVFDSFYIDCKLVFLSVKRRQQKAARRSVTICERWDQCNANSKCLTTETLPLHSILNIGI